VADSLIAWGVSREPRIARIALVTTPWDGSGESDAPTAALAARLAELVELDVYVERGREGGVSLHRPLRAADTLIPREYDHVLYSVAGDAAHAFMEPMLRRIGGTVWLHDWVLLELAFGAHPALARGGWRGRWAAACEGGLAQARTYAARERALAAGAPFERDDLPLQRGVVRFADAFVVASEAVRRRILDDRNAPTAIAVVPHGANPIATDADRRSARAALGWPETFRAAFVATTAGGDLPPERLEAWLDALAFVRSRGRDVRWAVAGPEGEAFERAAARKGLEGIVHRVPGAADLDAHVRAGDVELAGAGRTAPGTRARIARALGCGRAVIAAGEIAEEFRSPAVLVEEASSGSARALADLLDRLASDPGARAELERSAREGVERELDWGVVARRMLEHFGRFPHARGARRSLLSGPLSAQLARVRDARSDANTR
jgi:glycosyltransferase involved in cell wall biosynthesis